MNVGDRFLNIMTGTIIQITDRSDRDVVLECWYDSDGGYHENRTVRDYVIVTNINDNKKVKDLPIVQLEEYIRIANGRIVPYHGEPIKPIQYIKQHRWEHQQQLY